MQENRSLKRAIEALYGRAPSPPAQHRRQDEESGERGGDDEEDEEERRKRFTETVAYAGKDFAINHGIFLSRSFAFDAELSSDWDPKTSFRFANSVNIAEGQLRDVLALTKEFENSRKTATFEAEVRGGTCSNRTGFTQVI